MSVIILLLLASLSVSLIFLGAFIWSVKDKQFDDEFSPSIRILFEDKPGSLEHAADADSKNSKNKKIKSKYSN